MRERKESVGRLVEIAWIGDVGDGCGANVRPAAREDAAVDDNVKGDATCGSDVLETKGKASSMGLTDTDAANDGGNAIEEIDDDGAAAGGAPAEKANAIAGAVAAIGESTKLSPSGTGENTRGPARGPTGVFLLRRL